MSDRSAWVPSVETMDPAGRRIGIRVRWAGTGGWRCQMVDGWGYDEVVADHGFGRLPEAAARAERWEERLARRTFEQAVHDAAVELPPEPSGVPLLVHVADRRGWFGQDPFLVVDDDESGPVVDCLPVLVPAGRRVVRLLAPSGARSLAPSGRLDVEVPGDATVVHLRRSGLSLRRPAPLPAGHPHLAHCRFAPDAGRLPW